MRKLLPYEHQMIEALGITEEEYWQFYLARLNYKDEKKGTVFDVRNEAGTIALVLTIVGTLAQVGAALLAPKPEVPDQKMARRSRNQLFAPRYGFNSFQEVARYGEPVNLVYTNVDENQNGGGVRVNTSLVWSAVQSFGTSQYIQMLGVIGAGDIQSLAYGRTAFGQAALRDFPGQLYWLYAKDATSGPLLFGDKRLGDDNLDPTSDGKSQGDYVYQASLGGANTAQGFSQAFSPSSNNTLGLYNVVPINVVVLERDEDGNVRANDIDDLGTRIPLESRGEYWPNDWLSTNSRSPFPKDRELTLRFVENDVKNDRRIDTDAEEAAFNYRSSLISTIDASGIYKLGAAKFKLVRVVEEIAKDAAGEFVFRCIESGILCEEDYDIKSYLSIKNAKGEVVVAGKEEDLEQDLKAQKAALAALEAERNLWGTIYTGEGADKFEALTIEFDEIEDNIEAATAILRGNLSGQELYDVVKNEDQFKNITNQIENLQGDIKNFNDRIDDLNDGIADELDRPRDERDRDRIRRLKQRKKDRQQDKRNTKGAIDKLFERLTAKVIERGLFDQTPRTDLREERKKLKRRKNKVKERLGILASTLTEDTNAMNARAAEWESRYNPVVNAIAEIEKQLRNPQNFNDHFNVKCLAKVDELSYSTITNCDIVDFALKSKVFKRISGRQSKYADNKEQKHKDADNGLRLRTAMFWVKYREEGSGGDYKRIKAVFAIRKGTEVENYTSIRFLFNRRTKWSFRMEPIIDLAAELRTHFGGQDIPVAYLETRTFKNSRPTYSIASDNGEAQVLFQGKLLQTRNRLLPRNRNPGFVDEWGVFSMRSDTQISFSFDSGPEIGLAAVTEQQREPFAITLYQGISLIGFNAYSTKGMQDLRSLSAFVTRGKKVRKINDDGSYGGIGSSTSYAPEIFLDTVLDEENGIAAYADINGIDLEALGDAMKFCKVNELFMDGVIADPRSWREFWTTVAPYSLLEFSKVGGKESLRPALPMDAYGRISREISISALFNQGNILDGTYKEEFLDYGDNTEDLLLTIVYRNTEEDNVFPGNKSVELRLADSDEASCIRQTFDLSDFVSTRAQAIKYGMLLCQQRRWSKRMVEFKTFPTESPVAPGSYIYVQTDENQWDDLRSGKVEANGSINLPLSETIGSGTFDALLYKGGEGTIKLSSISVTDNASSALVPYQDWLIVLGTQLTNKRVFRVVEVAMEEEGEVMIKAMEHPCQEESGRTLSLIANLDQNLFLIE